MANNYEWGNNIFSDVLLTSILNGAEINDSNLKPQLYDIFSQIVEQITKNQKDIIYLDFDIKLNGIKYKLVANNFITALWFSGIFPENIYNLLDKTEYKNKFGQYSYNKKTKKITVKIYENE